jgi:hypothetical protein
VFQPLDKGRGRRLTQARMDLAYLEPNSQSMQKTVEGVYPALPSEL